MRVLIVEDEKRLAQALGQIMEEQHYQVDIVYDGADGLDYALSGQYDIVILDVMLPKKDGFEVLHELREHKISTPVLMLTARDDISDKVQGLDCGADDYMTKPFYAGGAAGPHPRAFPPAGGCAARGHPLGGPDPQAFFPHAALRRKVGQPGL